MPLVRPKVEILVEAVADTKKAEKNVKDLRQEVERVGTSSKRASGQMDKAFQGGLFGGVVGAAALHVVEQGLNFVVDSFNEVVELAEKKPELFTAEQLRNVQDYNSALGELKQSFTEIKIEIVSGIAPALAEMLRGLANSSDIRARANELVAMGASREQALAQASREVNDATREQAAATSEAALSMKEYEKAINDAIKTQNSYYSAQIGTVEKLAGLREKQINDNERLTDQLSEVREAINRENVLYGQQLNTVSWVRQANGKLRQERGVTLQEMNAHVVKIDELRQKEQELVDALQDVEVQSEKTRNKMIFDMVQEKLAADGLTSSAEFLYQLQVGKQLGIFTEADVKTLQDINQQADQLASAAPQALTPLEQSFKTVQGPMKTTLDIMKEISLYDGKLVNFGVNFYTASAVPATPTANSAPRLPGFGQTQRKAEGGAVYASTPYIVGERGPEMFVPRQSGEIVPNDRMGGVTINISGEFRNANDLNWLTQEIARRIR